MHAALLKQRTTMTETVVVVLPIAFRIRSTGGFAVVQRALVLTIDRPCGWLLPNLGIVVPDLEQFVYNSVRHFADKIAVALSSSVNH